MASPWRRRRLCILAANISTPAAMRRVSATGVFLETSARPELGEKVEVRHPDAGVISGIVRSVECDGVFVAFECSERSVSFALAAITADMSKPAD